MAKYNRTHRLSPAFEKGGKFYWLHGAAEAFDTFLYVPGTVSKSGCHVHDCVDLKRWMIIPVIAVLPAVLFGMWNIGYEHFVALGQHAGFWPIVWYGFLKILPMYLVSYIVGLGIEFISSQLSGKEVNEGYLVTGMLIPAIMPVNVPLWMLALSVAFADIFGKEIFGGTGMNIWNPALLARAFLFFSYPSHMTGDKAWVAGVDAVSGATPLAVASAGGMHGLAESGYSMVGMFLGNIPGSIAETSTVAILIGALILIATGVGSWKIMLGSVLGAVAVGGLGNLLAPGASSPLAVPFYYQLVMGGFAFGTVFMATDPVTSCQTETGKWIYGFLIGALCVTVRLFNPGYPEGMMLSILLMNTFAPLIDHMVVDANIRKRMRRV
ncbi:MAG: NADH:ubiquinone reductase (Na(+)-transporting) subunit B [Bacteroidales bacterium]|jgi:Na+-transporting NADH:ubiquinone oxidoreductase subunit B|nr:NADH:ubiquinone reductase (Na(+)-transporting) subunit B [Bacteroidales bacterium]MCI2121480.1 NADH:ubiquinone reductase (Na(+)-transporting) subunit B [Bacteroidales bacterium]MCI2145277.1 NADH:ubiquinone reductase (Na(+)-transporting) subunit B [Bacteroidales bacterium]